MTEQAAWRVVWRGILLVFGLLLVALLFRELQTVIVQLLLAILLASAGTPLVDRLSPRAPADSHRRRLGRGLAAALVFLAVVSLFGLGAVAIVAMSMYGCLHLLLGIDAKSVAERFEPGTPVRAPAGFLMLLSVGLGVAWITMILAHLSTGQVPSRVDQVVWPMDLVVAFPAMFWAGVWLWRRQPLGYVVAAILLVKGDLLGVTLLVNSWIATTFWNAAADPMVRVYALGGCGGLALPRWYLRHVRPARSIPPKEPIVEVVVHERSARRANA
jgi:hypothetical protein